MSKEFLVGIGNYMKEKKEQNREEMIKWWREYPPSVVLSVAEGSVWTWFIGLIVRGVLVLAL